MNIGHATMPVETSVGDGLASMDECAIFQHDRHCTLGALMDYTIHISIQYKDENHSGHKFIHEWDAIQRKPLKHWTPVESTEPQNTFMKLP